jgi:hypothetical protein
MQLSSQRKTALRHGQIALSLKLSRECAEGFGALVGMPLTMRNKVPTEHANTRNIITTNTFVFVAFTG